MWTCAFLKCTDDDGKVLSHAEEMEIVVRPKLSLADAELDGFDKLVSQLKPGESVTSEISISEEAAVENLRGKTVTLEIELLDVKRFEMPEMTPSLLTELGDFESADDLSEAVRKQLHNQLEWHQRKQVRQQASASLTASASWELPPDLLRRQSQRELERSILELRRSGFDDDSIKPALTAARIAPGSLTQGLHEIRTNRAANTAAINGDQGIVFDGCQQFVIQTHLTEFIDQH